MPYREHDDDVVQSGRADRPEKEHDAQEALSRNELARQDSEAFLADITLAETLNLAKALASAFNGEAVIELKLGGGSTQSVSLLYDTNSRDFGLKVCTPRLNRASGLSVGRQSASLSVQSGRLSKSLLTASVEYKVEAWAAQKVGIKVAATQKLTTDYPHTGRSFSVGLALGSGGGAAAGTTACLATNVGEGGRRVAERGGVEVSRLERAIESRVMGDFEFWNRWR
jgi:hypothetical protein